jgi:methyl-accepting chemotaxis protein
MQSESEGMLNWIRRFVKPPSYEDEDKTRTARLLNTILLTVTGFAAGYIPISVFVYPEPLPVLVTLILTVLLGAFARGLMHNGKIRQASIVLSSVLWVVMGLVALFSEGVFSPGFSLSTAVILIAGLLLGGQAGIICAGLSSVAGFGIFLLGQNDLLPASLMPTSAVVMWATQSMNFAVTAVLLFLATRGIDNALDSARRSNRELQATQVQLEDRLRVEREQRDQLKLLMTREQEQRENLQGVLGQVHEAANSLSSAVTEILATVTQQVTSANQQSAAITQTSTTTDEVKAISEQAIQRAREVVDASQRTVNVSRSGQDAVGEVIQVMSLIYTRVESIAENILALSEQTQQIGEIISSVSDIAAQSNMLALNASVEAARAGAQGKGFATVAAEVRNLAGQSKQATTQVKSILLDIQDGINSTVMATEEGTKVVAQGMGLVGQTGEVITQLAAAIEEAAQAATQMVAGGQQQAAGVDQIVQAMQQINQATKQNLASTRQAEEAARGLSDLANDLAVTVEQYQLVR